MIVFNGLYFKKTAVLLQLEFYRGTEGLSKNPFFFYSDHQYSRRIHGGCNHQFALMYPLIQPFFSRPFDAHTNLDSTLVKL